MIEEDDPEVPCPIIDVLTSGLMRDVFTPP
jgi:hypothetical protein